ncbi:branched-chain amino acid ABC transporter permease [Enterocloster bolteae]|uniref:branched-chain amino acid ABC transporter permease n=1 Tax=Enterocloster bolteae TaxID=208479 RepID=UPI002A7EEB92|nr:branched-chain amino acid ABC transporter permease [Enterocloster bolteae]
MSMFMQALFEGIINGSTLALVAMGIALVWGVMGILSFTQGEFLMIAMFCSFYLNLYFGLDPIVSLPICMAIMFGIGFIVYKLIIARALRGPVLSQRLITFALSMVLVNLALLLFSGDFKTIPEVAISGSIDLGFMVLSKQKIVPFVISVCVAGFMFLFLNKTRTGKAIRATSMNKTAAGLVGIKPEKTYALAFGLSAAIAGAAGCALTYFYYIYPNVGANFQLFGFIAVVMGGFGSIPGAFFGGLIMGLADSFTGVYMNTAFKYVGICVVFLLLVQFKPKGLFGGK